MRAAMILLALLCAGCGDHISVPVEACQRSATGRTETIVHYQCASFDAKSGACTVNMPVYITTSEVRYDCAFTRME